MWWLLCALVFGVVCCSGIFDQQHVLYTKALIAPNNKCTSTGFVCTYIYQLFIRSMTRLVGSVALHTIFMLLSESRCDSGTSLTDRKVDYHTLSYA